MIDWLDWVTDARHKISEVPENIEEVFVDLVQRWHNGDDSLWERSKDVIENIISELEAKIAIFDTLRDRIVMYEKQLKD
jgi:hypothetical protein